MWTSLWTGRKYYTSRDQSGKQQPHGHTDVTRLKRNVRKYANLVYMYFYIFCFYKSFRDSVMEMLFEQDNEEKSVASLILDALVKVLAIVLFWK